MLGISRRRGSASVDGGHQPDSRHLSLPAYDRPARRQTERSANADTDRRDCAACCTVPDYCAFLVPLPSWRDSNSPKHPLAPTHAMRLQVAPAGVLLAAALASQTAPLQLSSGSATSGTVAPLPASTAECAHTEFAIPTRVDPSSSRPLRLRFSRIAHSTGARYVLGTDDSLLQQPHRVPTLMVLDEEGRSIGRPEGDLVFAFPIGEIDAQGRLHVLWGEPAPGYWPGTPPAWLTMPIESIWSASFDPATHRWSRPRSIYSGSGFPVGWSAAVQDPQSVPGGGVSTAVLLPFGDASSVRGASALLILTREADSWSASARVPLRSNTDRKSVV